MGVDSGLYLMAACYGAGALSFLLARWSGASRSAWVTWPRSRAPWRESAFRSAFSSAARAARYPCRSRPSSRSRDVARGGRALGLLPARHLPRRRRRGHLRSGVPPGALARRRGAAGGAGARAQRLRRLHGARLLRRRRAHLPPLLGGHDARQLRPRRLRHREARTRARGSSTS